VSHCILLPLALPIDGIVELARRAPPMVVVASPKPARIKDCLWVQEPFLCAQQPSKGARTDAFPVQSLVRKPLAVVKPLERVGLVLEYNR
jgi:hypothetical protein